MGPVSAGRRPLASLVLVAAVGLLGSLVGGSEAPGAAASVHEAATGTEARAEAMTSERESDLGPTALDQVMDFGIVLRKAHPRLLEAFMAGLNDPASPDYGQYLTPEEFGRRFGLPDARIAEVTAWLTARGFEVGAAPPQRTSLSVRGTVGAVNDAFGVTMHDWVDHDGRPFRQPDRKARIPNELRRHVALVAPLDTRPEDAASAPLRSLPGGYLQAEHLARAFEIDELHRQGILGQGQSIGIISFDTFDDADVEAFDQRTDTAGRAGQAPLPVTRVRLGDALTSPGKAEGEVNLDIDVIRTVAPAAQIINYEARNGAGFVDVVKRIVADQDVDIVTVSYGRCELEKDRDRMEAEHAEFQAAAGVGITIFVSSGDQGAHDCRFFPTPVGNPQYRNLRLSATSPASDPDVVSVGGTYLTLSADGRYVAEAGWEDPLTGWGSGGGLSVVFPRPTWQVGPGVDNQFSTQMRQLPDVAGPADSDSGWLTVYTGPNDTQPTANVSGGTSASAPFWAASMLLVRQLAEKDGVHAPGFGQLGSLGRLLYQVAGAAAPGDLFHDVTRGGNLYYDAGTGWDYATGLGSPRVGPLARAIVDALR